VSCDDSLHGPQSLHCFVEKCPCDDDALHRVVSFLPYKHDGADCREKISETAGSQDVTLPAPYTAYRMACAHVSPCPSLQPGTPCCSTTRSGRLSMA
jgi:hypothetical protein